MSSNRVPANQNTRVHHSQLRQVCSQWTSIIPVLVLALALGGCALNSTGLPGGLPVPPGGGTLTISRSTLAAGITGRTYSIWIPTSGGTGTLAAGGCTIIAGGLPAGLSIAPSSDLPATAAVSFCRITGTLTTVGPAIVSFTLQASDTATPSNTASQAFSISVRPEYRHHGNSIPRRRNWTNLRQCAGIAATRSHRCKRGSRQCAADYLCFHDCR